MPKPTCDFLQGGPAEILDAGVGIPKQTYNGPGMFRSGTGGLFDFAEDLHGTQPSALGFAGNFGNDHVGFGISDRPFK